MANGGWVKTPDGEIVPLGTDWVSRAQTAYRNALRIAALKEGCLNQFQNCGYMALTFTIWLRVLRWVKLFSLFAPVVLGALATWNIVGEAMPATAAVCAFLAVLIPPPFQAAKLDASIKQYTTMAGEFTNLRDRFRLAAEFSSLKPFDEFEAEFKSLIGRLEKARARAHATALVLSHGTEAMAEGLL